MKWVLSRAVKYLWKLYRDVLGLAARPRRIEICYIRRIHVDNKFFVLTLTMTYVYFIVFAFESFYLVL